MSILNSIIYKSYIHVKMSILPLVIYKNYNNEKISFLPSVIYKNYYSLKKMLFSLPHLFLEINVI